MKKLKKLENLAITKANQLQIKGGAGPFVDFETSDDSSPTTQHDPTWKNYNDGNGTHYVCDHRNDVSK